ncbi:hypothetical protein BsIDN1_40930 [Bacillus safensis]|uniref:Transcriptional repressor n=1 Tax=Bacillus safensis TaxID=561879 RepID=A0A5S9MC80_BACIA|nr:hypothetical protein BsIDN1_40930 [Bacillus safensis]
MENRIDRIKKQLHSSSYKLTPQREATVRRVLLENEEDHLSAEDVYLLVKESLLKLVLLLFIGR